MHTQVKAEDALLAQARELDQYVTGRSPSTDTATDIGTSPASSNILLDLQAHRINADRGGGTGFDREAPICRKDEKVSVDVMGETVAR